jgi:hypothetical protein
VRCWIPHRQPYQIESTALSSNSSESGKVEKYLICLCLPDILTPCIKMSICSKRKLTLLRALRIPKSRNAYQPL